MKLGSKHSFVAASWFLGAACSVLAHDAKSPLVLNLQREKVSDTRVAHKYRRRDGTNSPTSVTLYDNSTLYYADVTIGTLGQPFKLQVTCDASDTWVNLANSTFCEQNLASCQSSGLYTPSSSSTYQYVSGGFSNQYLDGTGVSGAWATDDLAIGNTTVTGLQFGVAYNSTIPVGILGLGYIGLETYANPDQQQYPNLPVLMYNQNLIDCISYSIWLDKSSADQGRLVFGGLDTGKFIGPLETLHISTDNLTGYHYATITMDSVALSLNGKHDTISDGPIQIAPDSGVTEIDLPNATAYRIFEDFGAVYENSTAWLDCAYQTNATTLDFVFGSTTISVPMEELVSTYSGSCYLNIQPVNDSFSLGLAFLRSAYVVFDFSNNQISLAPTNPGATTDNVTVIGPNGVFDAGFVGVGPSNTTSSAPNGTTPPSAPPSSTHPSGLTTGAKVGIGVGVPLAVVVLLAVGAFFLFFRRRHQPHATVAAAPPLPAKSQPYSSHRTSELETTQRYSAMSPGSFGWRHDYSPVQPGPPELRAGPEEARELEG